MKRYVAIWLRHLLVDRVLLTWPELEGKPFVLATKERNRVVVKASSRDALKLGIEPGMVLADARAVQPELEVLDYDLALPEKLLRALAEWAIRYSPLVAVDLPDGLILDATDHISSFAFPEYPVITRQGTELVLSEMEWSLDPVYEKNPVERRKRRTKMADIQSERVLGDTRS